MFALRFSTETILHWTTQYDYPGEAAIENELAPRIHERGYITHAELVALCHWKSPRIRTRCEGNSAEYVEAITQTALTTPNERLRIEVLTLLHGVGWPMASVILQRFFVCLGAVQYPAWRVGPSAARPAIFSRRCSATDVATAVPAT